ncbi:MAG: alanine racemase [Jiangellales bacterium]
MSPPVVPHALVEVDLGAVRDNVAVLAAKARPAATMAVVKADAYGHGLVPVARAAQAGGATWLGTAVLAEALALREAGLTGRILAWLSAPGDEYDAALDADIDVAAYADWQLDEIAEAARRTGRQARVHLKADTGLTRGGVMPTDWPGALDRCAALEAEGVLAVVGVWTHFAYADAPGHPTIAAQLDAFRHAVELAHRSGLRPEVCHAANSAATLTLPEAHFDLVRPGLAVYGLSPIPEVASADELGLRPAMRLSAQVALVKTVPPHEGVSYGHTYTTTDDTQVALVPLGYADGVPRHASNTGPVRVGGATFPVAGRVCMDQIVLDIGDVPVAPGDTAVLFSDGRDGEPTAQDWAQAAGTISYEIVTRVSSRLPRRFVGLGAATEHEGRLDG